MSSSLYLRTEWIRHPKNEEMFLYDERTDTLNFYGGRQIRRPQEYPPACLRDNSAFQRFLAALRAPTFGSSPPEGNFAIALDSTCVPSYAQVPRTPFPSQTPPESSSRDLDDVPSRLSRSETAQPSRIPLHLGKGKGRMLSDGSTGQHKSTSPAQDTASAQPPDARRPATAIPSNVVGPTILQSRLRQIPQAASTAGQRAQQLLPATITQSEVKICDWANQKIDPREQIQQVGTMQGSLPGLIVKPASRVATVTPQIIRRDRSEFVSFQDPSSGVRAWFQSNPAEEITDPALFKRGIKAYRKLLATGAAGDSEKLFPDFKVREHPRKFFKFGRVFLVLWVQPAGEKGTVITNEAEGVHIGRFGEKVFSKVRRFVVIREGELYCSALPIATYGLQGVGKPGVNKSEHGIIYTGSTAPGPMPTELAQPGEYGMRPTPIRVDPDQPTEKLDWRSRIDYGKVHTIEHNIKVSSLGKVHPKSESHLKHQFLEVWTQLLGSSERTASNLAVSARSSARFSSTSARNTRSADTHYYPSAFRSQNTQSVGPGLDQELRRQGLQGGPRFTQISKTRSNAGEAEDSGDEGEQGG